MESEQDINSLRDEVFRKIGRNVFNFHQIERLLKVLIASADLSGWADNLQTNLELKRAKVAKQTMGNLVGELFGSTIRSLEETEDRDENIQEPRLSFSFSVDVEFYESKQRELALLVADRNELIHHKLGEFKPDSQESCQEFIEYLDSQRERQIKEYDFLKALALNLSETMAESAECMKSEEFMKEYCLFFLAHSPIVQFLILFAQEKPRPDGWTYLSAAISKICKELPEDLEKIKNGWGYKKLSDLIQDFDFFELKQEPLANGGCRWLYRVSPECVVECNETQH